MQQWSRLHKHIQGSMGFWQNRTFFVCMLICIQKRPCVKTGYFQIPGFTQSLLRSGTDGVRTHDLSRVRRTLIPAELPFRNKRIPLYCNKERKKGIFRFPFSVRKMGLEPTRCSQHKILSLARLPIPTLPHALPKRKMQEMGLEPTLCCHNRHLKPARLPFRHSCERMLFYRFKIWLSTDILPPAREQESTKAKKV